MWLVFNVGKPIAIQRKAKENIISFIIITIIFNGMKQQAVSWIASLLAALTNLPASQYKTERQVFNIFHFLCLVGCPASKGIQWCRHNHSLPLPGLLLNTKQIHNHINVYM